MSFGWCGQFLRVDLTSGELCTVPLALEEVKDFIGAYGLGVYLHGREQAAEAGPGPDGDPLIYATSPLTGTLLPNGGHFSVVTRVAQGAYLSCANVGGAWGSELKYAGFDAVVIHGKSAKPVYLQICDGVAELCDAGNLWGKNVGETNDLLRSKCGKKSHVCCIGPAGENKLKVAAIVSDASFASGAPGVAAVAGDKKLKAIVVRGTKGIRLARAAEFLETAQKVRARSMATLLSVQGSRPQPSVLHATSVAADTQELPENAVRPQGCFGCATAFTSFTDKMTGETITNFHDESLPGKDAVRLLEQRAFIDLGLDYVSAKAFLASCESDTTQNPVELAGDLARGNMDNVVENEAHTGEVGNSGCVVGGYLLVPAGEISRSGSGAGMSTFLSVAAQSAGCCPFTAASMKAPEIATLLSSATGIDYSTEDILRAGKRIASAAGK